MGIQRDFEISSAQSFQVDIHICNNEEHGGIYIVDKHYNSYDEFIDRMYDMCKALNIGLIAHDPQDGLTTTFHFLESSDAYAFDIILKGSTEQTEPEYFHPMNSSIPLEIFEQAIIQFCHNNSIRIANILRIDEEQAVRIITDRNIGMSAILLADKRGLFDLMAMKKMQENTAECIFNIDLPRHIVDIKKFQQNFDTVCGDNNIIAKFDMDTPYIRRLRITTNNENHVTTLKQLHANGAFNVGLHYRQILTLPELGN